MPKLCANFEADLIAQVRQNLVVMWGFQYTKKIADRDVLIYYFDSLRRRVIPRPRKIQIADTFQCPLPCLNGWMVLQKKVASGESIRPHLSKPHESLFNRDGLLNEWGIHHFHLGTCPDSNNIRYVERTGTVIFAYVTDDIFYAVNVYEHTNNHLKARASSKAYIAIGRR